MVCSIHLCLILFFVLMLLLVLVNNLHVYIKPMYRLYCILKDWEEPPTPDKIAVASCKKKLDGSTEAEYMKKLENVSENIKKAFEDQQVWARVSENHLFDYLCLMYHSTGTMGPGKI